MNTREEILARLLEGTIEESEIPALRDEIARDPAFAAEITDLTRIDRLLRFQAYLETEKPDLVIGVLKRLEFEEQDQKAFNHAWQRKINQQQNRGRLAKLIRFVVTPLAIAASLAVVAGGVWWFSQPQAGSLELRVVEVRGTVSGFRFQGSGGPESGVIESPSHRVAKVGEAGNIEHRTSNTQRRSEDAGSTRDTRHSTLKVDDILRPGDGVEVGANGYAKLVYPDRTQVELRQNTRLRVALGEGENKDAKRLALDGGKLVCSAVPQKKAFEIQTSHAVSRVVGTRFSLDVTEAESRLGVQEGKVELRQDEKILLVSAGEAAVATTKGMEMSPAPAGSGSKVYAWGDNQYGQLGIGSTNNSLLPVLVPGLSGTTAIAAGKGHTLALHGDGTVWVWGWNGYGQIGDGTKIDQFSPVQVKLPDGSLLSKVTSLAPGYEHNLVLKADGTIWQWGRNSSLTPSLGQSISGVSSIARLSQYTVALKKDGSVWAWNSGGRGDGAKMARSLIPVRVSGLSDVTAIAVGYGCAVALKNDGSVWTWGKNGVGQLGDGTKVEHLDPLRVSGLSHVRSIAAGGAHTGVIKEDGSVWTWGNNDSGQLGDGTKEPRLAPVQVRLQDGSPLSNVRALVVADVHTVALKNDGTVWAWGNNDFGQLGDGTSGVSATRLNPVQVKLQDGTPLTQVIAIAAGHYHTVALVGEWGD
jgi:alpha-tubulin suppressor-like RCC1 family protein